VKASRAPVSLWSLIFGTMHRENPKRKEDMAYLEGQLRRRTDEIEGEHTSYILEVEIEMSAVQNPEEFVDEQVAITGDLEIIDFPERGRILVFRATSAAALEEEG
jgi:hypothetical protein